MHFSSSVIIHFKDMSILCCFRRVLHTEHQCSFSFTNLIIILKKHVLALSNACDLNFKYFSLTLLSLKISTVDFVLFFLFF